jgi:3,8-divinyl chlorophyllide a/chlorophyllide a reductase subunit Z
MGYAGATYLIQEVCNALFDALFNILPLGTDLDRIDATPVRDHREMPWNDAAVEKFERLIASEPVLVRISAAKRLRDSAEQRARATGEAEVQPVHVETSAALAEERVRS